MQFPAEMTPKEILLQYLAEVGTHVLADPVDADFFRANFVKKPTPKQAPLPEPILVETKPIAVAPPIPKPVPKVEPPPKPLEPKKTEAPQEVSIPVPEVDFQSLRHLLSTIAPELAILPDIPSDAIAKKLSTRWKTKNQTAPISILCGQEPPEQRALLEQIARALDVYFSGARLIQAETIEKEKQWEAFLSVSELKTVIVCDYTLWQLGGLMQHYKETPSQGTRMLKDVPLFLLPDLSLYLKDPLLKRSLWKALCQKFS